MNEVCVYVCLYRLSPTIKHKMFLVDNDKSHKFLHTMLAQTSIDPMQGFIDNPDTEIQSWWWMFNLEIGLHKSVLKMLWITPVILSMRASMIICYTIRSAIRCLSETRLLIWKYDFSRKHLLICITITTHIDYRGLTKSLKFEIVLLKIFIMMRPQYHILY